MVVDSLHSQVSQLASGGGIDRRELSRGTWASCLALLSAYASGWSWRWLVLGLVLLSTGMVRISSLLR
jgi:hypothetical protein